MNGLYRCSVTLTHCLPQKTKGTYYVVGSSREDASLFLRSHLRAGGKITAISFLGECYGYRLYGRVHK